MSQLYGLRIEGVEGEDLQQVIQLVHRALAGVAKPCQVPAFEVTVVVADDFNEAVRSRTCSGQFDSERLGGSVVGKTMPVKDDYSVVDVVLDATPFRDNPMLPGPVAWLVHLLAHEFGHVLFGRLRAATCSSITLAELQTPGEVGGQCAVETIEEYRCDLVASIAMSICLKEMYPGVPELESFSAWDLLGEIQVESLEGVLDGRVHPGWPDLVQSYREWEVDLTDMYYRLMREIDQVLKLLAHVEAAARSGERRSPLGSFGEHPAVQLYLGPTWATIVTVLDGHPVIPSKDDFAATDEAVRQAGAKAITDLCAMLGITAELRQEGVMHLNVTAPQR